MGIGIGSLSSEEIIRFYLHVEYQHKYCTSIERYYGDIYKYKTDRGIQKGIVVKDDNDTKSLENLDRECTIFLCKSINSPLNLIKSKKNNLESDGDLTLTELEFAFVGINTQKFVKEICSRIKYADSYIEISGFELFVDLSDLNIEFIRYIPAFFNNLYELKLNRNKLWMLPYPLPSNTQKLELTSNWFPDSITDHYEFDDPNAEIMKRIIDIYSFKEIHNSDSENLTLLKSFLKYRKIQSFIKNNLGCNQQLILRLDKIESVFCAINQISPLNISSPIQRKNDSLFCITNSSSSLSKIKEDSKYIKFFSNDNYETLPEKTRNFDSFTVLECSLNKNNHKIKTTYDMLYCYHCRIFRITLAVNRWEFEGRLMGQCPECRSTNTSWIITINNNLYSSEIFPFAVAKSYIGSNTSSCDHETYLISNFEYCKKCHIKIEKNNEQTVIIDLDKSPMNNSTKVFTVRRGGE